MKRISKHLISFGAYISIFKLALLIKAPVITLFFISFLYIGFILYYKPTSLSNEFYLKSLNITQADLSNARRIYSENQKLCQICGNTLIEGVGYKRTSVFCSFTCKAVNYYPLFAILSVLFFIFGLVIPWMFFPAWILAVVTVLGCENHNIAYRFRRYKSWKLRGNWIRTI